jgi:polysaccharide pyruvyl transferase WcaK-like protein
LALSICGGDSFSDIYGTGRFIYIALPLLWALSMKKKLMLLPQTIGPFKGRFAVALASFIMKRSEMVYARDRESFELARRLMGASHETKANFCYDMGFVLNPIKPESGMWADAKAPTSNSPLVGLNVSGLLSMGGYDRNNMFSLNVDYTDLIRSLISYLIEEKRTGVLLIPHVFGAWQESDVAAVNRLYGELAGRYPAGLFAVQGAFDQHEIKYIIGRCDFFIGSRMHACIAALSQGIPAVGIAYSRKFDGVMKTVGVESLIADPRRSTKAEILRSIGRAFDEREKWAALLRGKMPEVVSTVLGLLREVPARP